MNTSDQKNSSDEDQKRKLDQLLKIYVTKPEKVKLVNWAEIVGISFSAFGRAILLDYEFEKDFVDIRRIRFELNKIGVNLNQLAKVANQEGKLPTREQLEKFHKEIINLAEEV